MTTATLLGVATPAMDAADELLPLPVAAELLELVLVLLLEEPLPQPANVVPKVAIATIHNACVVLRLMCDYLCLSSIEKLLEVVVAWHICITRDDPPRQSGSLQSFCSQILREIQQITQ